MTSGIRDYGPGVDMTASDAPGTNFMGPLTDPSYGDVTSQVDTFRGVPMSQPGTDFFGGDVTAPATPAPVTPAWSPPSMTPTAPATPAVDNFAQVQAERQRANEFASAQQEAAARQQEAARVQEQLAYQQAESRLMQSRDRGRASEAEIRQEMANDAKFGSGLGFLGRDERNGGGYSESGMGQQGGRGHPGMR
jgi:hypothetical protein